ncbi:MAG: FprA family A-type flavoprotein [Thermoplasmatota archaeon]
MRKIREDVFYVGAQHWDRRLFDELIPTPEGTSYNAYLIKGSEKTVLIDSVDPAKEQVLFDNLSGIDRIDYVVANHAEQDHSGTLLKVLEKYPDSKLVTNLKCRDFLMDHVMIPEDRFMVVGDRDTLSLGNKTLEFILAPWVHWPETMFTYLREDRTLFPCDFLGSHVATTELFAGENMEIYYGAKRYYAEIMMPFKHIIPKHLQKISELEIDLICPSHGPIWDKPEFILSAYRDWTSPEVRNQVLIPYVSMHDSTRIMVEHLTEELVNRGVDVKVFNLTVTDLGELAMAMVDAATIVFGVPTVLTGAHPVAYYAVYLTNALRPKARHVGLIGSYGWGCRTVDQVKESLSNLKAEFLDPVYIKGIPKEEDLRSISKLADAIADKHKNM